MFNRNQKSLKIKRGTPIRNVALAITLTYSVLSSAFIYGLATNRVEINMGGIYQTTQVDQPTAQLLAELGFVNP